MDTRKPASHPCKKVLSPGNEIITRTIIYSHPLGLFATISTKNGPTATTGHLLLTPTSVMKTLPSLSILKSFNQINLAHMLLKGGCSLCQPKSVPVPFSSDLIFQRLRSCSSPLSELGCLCFVCWFNSSGFFLSVGGFVLKILKPQGP